MSIKRFVPSAGLAIGTTTVIGLFMAAMIAAEFTPQEKSVALGFEINPVEPDIEIRLDRTPPKLTQRVETPPPPPMIAREKTGKPAEKIASVTGAIPVFEPPKIDNRVFEISLSDTDAQPLVRIAPIMPPKAQKSGHCNVRFDVSPEGAPFNINATYCSQKIFQAATVKSVQRWKYKPKIVKNRAVSRTGVESMISFRLTDEHGQIIPE